MQELRAFLVIRGFFFGRGADIKKLIMNMIILGLHILVFIILSCRLYKLNKIDTLRVAWSSSLHSSA